MQAVCMWNISNEFSLPAHLQSRLLLWTCLCVCVCVCVHVCDLEVFMAVMIIIRLGIYMVLSPFKVPLSKKNLKGTFLSPSSFHSSRSHSFY